MDRARPDRDGSLSQLADAPAGIENLINSTQTLPAPTSQDASAVYAASTDSLVQFTSNGDIYFLPSAFGNGWNVQVSATWQKSSFSVAGLTGSTGAATGSSASASASVSVSSGARSATLTTSGTATGASQTVTASTGASNSGSKMASPLAQAAALVFVVAVVGARL